MNFIKIIVSSLLLLMQSSSFSMDCKIPDSIKEDLKQACESKNIEKALSIMSHNYLIFGMQKYTDFLHRKKGIIDNSFETTKIAMIDLFNIFLESSIDINTQNKDGETLLHIACKQGTIEHVQLILKKRPNIDPNIKNEYGETPIFLPSFCNREDRKNIVDALVNTGKINLHETNNKKETFFYDLGNTNSLPDFITNFTSLEQKAFFTEELHMITQTQIETHHDDRNNVRICKFIKHCFENGADIKHRNDEGKTALEQAMERHVYGKKSMSKKKRTPTQFFVDEMIYYSFLEKDPNTVHRFIYEQLIKNKIIHSEIVKKIMGLYIALFIEHFWAQKYVNACLRTGYTSDRRCTVERGTTPKSNLLAEICDKFTYINPYTKKQFSDS